MIPTNINRQAKAPEQNVQPGTVVDKGVMNAAVTEFLLIAHKALQVLTNKHNFFQRNNCTYFPGYGSACPLHCGF